MKGKKKRIWIAAAAVVLLLGALYWQVNRFKVKPLAV